LFTANSDILIPIIFERMAPHRHRRMPIHPHTRYTRPGTGRRSGSPPSLRSERPSSFLPRLARGERGKDEAARRRGRFSPGRLC
jgi:hypothetical protein